MALMDTEQRANGGGSRDDNSSQTEVTCGLGIPSGYPSAPVIWYRIHNLYFRVGDLLVNAIGGAPRPCKHVVSTRYTVVRVAV